MAKSKNITVKDIRAHLFMSVLGNHVDLVYHDDADNGAGLGAALASLLEQDDKLMSIVSAALMTVLEQKEKYNSKNGNIMPKTVKKAAKKK